MSASSKEFRRIAARKLRTARLSGLTEKERQALRREAAGYKSLAQKDAWLQGEPERPGEADQTRKKRIQEYRDELYARTKIH
jgi:hypothetical protein